MRRIHRGIVCEKKSKYTVFLTNQGDFLRGIPIGTTPKIGEESEFHLISTATSPLRKGKLRFVGAALVAALFFLFIVASLISPDDEVMAYVQLETDNAMELGVNEEGEVISLRYLDDTSDATDEWGKKSVPIRDVLDQVAKSTSSLGEKQIIATTIIVNQESGHQAKKVIGSALHDMQTTHKDLKWKVGESTVEERELANQKGMSIQKFNKNEQAPSRKEKKPSSEMGPPQKSESVPSQQQTESPKSKTGSTIPINGKHHGKETQQKPNERIENKSEKAVTAPKHPGNSGQGKKEKQTPAPKEKPETPGSEKKSENGKRQNPASDKDQDSKSFSNHPKEKADKPETSKSQGNNGN
ncbi:hypothetical protein AB1K83_15810 [Sporosarcina sp. 179-K 3D1 HS]|uniref:anti-sigma factor domain-containing protein n=1 Tax=Sporosarcina sp. 179-K 3D1 HS TaxID=3232169 RepID=UPI0039A19A58